MSIAVTRKPALVALRGRTGVVGRRLATKATRVSFAEDEAPYDVVEDLGSKDEKSKNIEECMWVPRPRTGIYFPKGHDWVMEDVPESAASAAPTFWLRNVDGVDRHHVDCY